MTTPCQEWFAEQIKAHNPPTANALAVDWGIPSSYMARWCKQGQVPEFYRIPDLAKKSGTPVADLERIFLASEKIKSAERKRQKASIDRRLFVKKPPQMVKVGRLYERDRPQTLVHAEAGG